MFVILGFAAHPVSTTTHENVIFESIGEMAGATSYLHVQVTISLSSITQQFKLYKAKLQSNLPTHTEELLLSTSNSPRT
jgi:hypothetical protein